MTSQIKSSNGHLVVKSGVCSLCGAKGEALDKQCSIDIRRDALKASSKQLKGKGDR